MNEKFRRAFVSAWVNGNCRVLIARPESNLNLLLLDRDAFLKSPTSTGNLWFDAVRPDFDPDNPDSVTRITEETEVIPRPDRAEGWEGYRNRLNAPGPKVRIANLPDLRSAEWIASILGIRVDRVRLHGPDFYIPHVAELLNQYARDPKHPGTLFIVTEEDPKWRDEFREALSSRYRELPLSLE